MLKMIAICCVMAAVCAGCYQAHSGDDLRTVPATNNPHLVGEAASRSVAPTYNY